MHTGSESSNFSDEDGNDETSMVPVTELTFLQWLWAIKHSWHVPFMNSCNPYSVRKAILLPLLLKPFYRWGTWSIALQGHAWIYIGLMTQQTFKSRQPTKSLSSTDNLKSQTIVSEMTFSVLWSVVHANSVLINKLPLTQSIKTLGLHSDKHVD